MAYKFNDSALYVTGSVVLSSSLYVSWGEATGSAATVGLRQNANGTLEYKDHSSGSWTEFGDSLDDTVFGDESTDVFTFIGQITASEGILIKDDKKLYFGDSEEASIEYDEDQSNRLIIKAPAAGVDITGSLYVSGSVYANEYVVDTVTTTVTNIEQQGSTKFGDSADDVHQFTGSVHIADDDKLYFGANQDASIEYDEDGTDELVISGALGGIDIQAPVYVADALTISSDGAPYLTFQTISGYTLFNKNAAVLDDIKLYFGNGAEASIEYNEDGNDRLTVSGSANGIDITGSTYFASGSHVVIDDDSKLYFGKGLDAYIEYNEKVADELVVSGALGGIDIQAPVNVTDAFTFSADGSAYMTINTIGAGVTKFAKATQHFDDIPLYFGTNYEASIEYNEDGNDRLTVSGSANGIDITGSTYFASGSHVVIDDDSKLYFGKGLDASIEYNEKGNDRIKISGSTAGIEITGSVYHTGSYNLSGQIVITSGGAEPMLVMDDSDSSAQIGRTHIGYDGTNSDMAVFAHQDMATQTNFALRQRSSGQTEINAKSGQSISFKLASANKAILNSSGHFNLLDDVKLLFGTGEESSITYDEAGSDRLTISGSAAGINITGSVYITGSFIPGADDLHDLGSSSKRWANVYTGDLHLKNNKGDWTILEEENYLCVINNKTNKRYKMMLEEIED